MKRLATMLAVLAVVALPRPGSAQTSDPFEDWPTRRYVQVQTVGGSRLVGIFDAQALKVKSEDLGEIEIKMALVHAINFNVASDPPPGGATRDVDTIVTTSNAIIRGTIQLEAITIESEIGTLTIGREKLRSLSITQGGGASSINRQDVQPAPAPGSGTPPAGSSSAPTPARNRIPGGSDQPGGVSDLRPMARRPGAGRGSAG